MGKRNRPRSGATAAADVEAEYQSRMDALEGRERVARAVGMLQWTRETLARQVVEDLGPLSDERLKWEVAARLYGADDPVQEAIRQRLADVSS